MRDELRICAICRIPIMHRNKNAIYCKKCQKKREIEQTKEWRRENE